MDAMDAMHKEEDRHGGLSHNRINCDRHNNLTHEQHELSIQQPEEKAPPPIRGPEEGLVT